MTKNKLFWLCFLLIRCGVEYPEGTYATTLTVTHTDDPMRYVGESFNDEWRLKHNEKTGRYKLFIHDFFLSGSDNSEHQDDPIVLSYYYSFNNPCRSTIYLDVIFDTMNENKISGTATEFFALCTFMGEDSPAQYIYWMTKYKVEGSRFGGESN